ncbi:hypothetical protein [Paucibacter sp. Y2R2-4]|uniref:hypothetical protein n=1 Tax=Paucibacter sp. Y2R2-4 TaxID=2893553 RepID=UPI0021E4ECA7|nr:hypothetical protein [Paucibacter sp. Y2R2-4]MCV2351017.1 hypothetical protein [Paucibacter sp. Y2R2-4]
MLPLFIGLEGLKGCASSDKPTGPDAEAKAASPQRKPRIYTEQVASLLISQDRKQLVVLGEQYHYVFEAPADLVRLLESPLKARLSAAIGPFHIALNGSTQGGYQVFLPADLNEDEAELAQSLGFMKTTSEHSGWALARPLQGKRYVVGNTFRAARSQHQLNRSYTVTMEAEEAPGQKTVEQLATPVAIASDGVLLIYYVALAPLLIPLIFLSKEKRPGAAQAASAPSPATQP